MNNYQNVILNIDVLEGFKLLDDKSIDYIITSPPYNIGIKYDNWNDEMLWDEYLSWCTAWIKEIKRVLKPDGRFSINVLIEKGNNNNKERVSPQVEFYNIIKECGLHINSQILWYDRHKSKLTSFGSWRSASSPYIYNPCEIIISGFNILNKKIDKGISTITKEDFLKVTSGILDFTPETKPLTIVNFPIELPKILIEVFTYKNDLVLDPFIGAGTTAIACLITGRRYIGFEISKNYCDIAEKRINGVNTLDDFFTR